MLNSTIEKTNRSKIMRIARLQDMTGGWFIGDFHPSLFRIKAFEVAVQHFHAGEYAEKHVHKIATEYTVIVAGKTVINGTTFGQGDIIVLEPGESADFRALTDVTTAVVKILFSRRLSEAVIDDEVRP